MSTSKGSLPTTPHASRFTLPVASLLLMAGIYLAGLLPLPPQALTHHDEGAKYLQVRNLRIAPSGLDWSINYPARRLDPRLEFVPFHPKQHYVDGQGRIYLQWPIFLGLLTRVPWKLMGFWGLYMVPLLAGLGTLWASYLLALQAGVPSRVAWLAVPVVGLATPVSLYSLLYFEHTLAALLVALSLLAALRGLRGGQVSSRSLALSGALLAVAVYFRSELYVLALVVALLLAVIGWKRRLQALPIGWIVGFAASLVPLWAFYALNEGSLLPTHALWYFTGTEPANGGGIPRAGLPPLRYIASAGWGVVPAFLFGPESAPFAPRFPLWVEAAGLAGAALCALGALAKLVSRRLAWALPVFLAGLGLVLLSTAATLFSPQPYYNLHGFLLAAPFVAVALWPPSKVQSPKSKVQRRDQDDVGLCRGGSRTAPTDFGPERSDEDFGLRLGFLYAAGLLYVGLHALVISALSGLGPISLHEWGQRYLLPAYPLLAVMSLAALPGIGREVRGSGLGAVRAVGAVREPPLRAALVMWAALVLVGVGFTARGYAALAEERAQVAGWLALANTMPTGEPLVTDTWWLPLDLAAGFYSRPYMLAEGDQRLAQWANQMRGKGVGRFGFATTDPSVFTGAWARQVSGLRAEGPPEQSRGLWLQRYTLAP